MKINYQGLISSGSADSGGINILMKSYQTINILTRKYGIKLNIPETLFVTFEPEPLYLRTNPQSGVV
jgi:hypothetical protein